MPPIPCVPECRLTVSLQDQRRYFENLSKLTWPLTSISASVLETSLGRAAGDLRTPLALRALAQAGLIRFDADGAQVSITDGGLEIAQALSRS